MSTSTNCYSAPQKESFSPRLFSSTRKESALLSNRQQLQKSIQKTLQGSLLSGLATALTLTLTGSPATAATFIFDSTQVAGNTTVGTHEAITTTFDDTTDLFTWSVTLSRNAINNRLADGGWLVVNAGGNPKADEQESVIFYLDGEAGQVSAYNYSGKHRSHSWQTSNFLGATALRVENSGNERTLSFAFDMSQINHMTHTFGPNWKGTAFAEQVGIWFHGVDGLMADYTDAGDLTQFSYSHQGWYDTNSKQTVSAAILNSAQDIPEPSVLISLGLLASALMFKPQ
ncbi:MAG: hypothetical protein AAFP03_05975 [Cyanobacteria bacterium J06598_3]